MYIRIPYWFQLMLLRHWLSICNTTYIYIYIYIQDLFVIFFNKLTKLIMTLGMSRPIRAWTSGMCNKQKKTGGIKNLIHTVIFLVENIFDVILDGLALHLLPYSKWILYPIWMTCLSEISTNSIRLFLAVLTVCEPSIMSGSPTDHKCALLFGSGSYVQEQLELIWWMMH